MYLQGVESVFDLLWTDGPLGRVTYGDVFHQNEVEMSTYTSSTPTPPPCSLRSIPAKPKASD